MERMDTSDNEVLFIRPVVPIHLSPLRPCLPAEFLRMIGEHRRRCLFAPRTAPRSVIHPQTLGHRPFLPPAAGLVVDLDVDAAPSVLIRKIRVQRVVITA